ncbi:MAG: hypothetical protein Q9195_008897 [Heterodermia aff. obscurata]
MAPSNPRGQGKPPGNSWLRRIILSRATDDTKPIHVPRRIFREHHAPPDDQSTASSTALDAPLIDSVLDDWHGYGEDLQIGAYDDSSSSSSASTYNSAENIQPSSSSSGGKAYVKKRRRLSVRPGAGESSTNVLSDVASSQDIDSGLSQTPPSIEPDFMANFFDPSYHSQLSKYTDAQVQTSPGRAAPGVDEKSDLHSPLHKLKELNDIIWQRGRSTAKTMKEKKPAQRVPTIPGTDYQLPPHWDPPSPPIKPLAHGDGGWPANVVPVEIFEHVGSSLSRDDLLSMRLVNHEFEAKISSRIFQTVVVPFKSDIYGVADSDAAEVDSTADSAGRDSHKDKVTLTSPCPPLTDGMEVFRSWGQRIKKYALTFEFDEETFCKLPAKDYYKDEISFWGNYKWPRAEYTRFKTCEQLEKKADETRCMTLALSHLTSLNELGLAVDSGLGWLAGPDCSDRVHIFREKQKIFGPAYSKPNRGQRNQKWIWDAISLEARRDSAQPQTRFSRANPAFERGDSSQGEPTTFQTIHGPYYELVAIPDLEWAQVPRRDVYPRLIFRGLDLESGLRDRDNVLCRSSYPSDALKPNELKYSHLEWLMENEWAQQAFLTSFTLSVTDNASNFRHIQTLNIAKLSSRYLVALTNQAFWSALPNLQTLKMFVSPDWRDIVRGPDERLQDGIICPSAAAVQFFNFLENCVAKREHITTLDIGWIGGGERATGLFARNQNILPGPVLSIIDPESALLACKVLTLPFVKHLSLTNCWFHPSALKVFVRRMEHANLQSLKLESVSLTALAGAGGTHTAPGLPNHPQAAQILALAQTQVAATYQLMQANINVQVPPAGNAAFNPQPPPPGIGHAGTHGINQAAVLHQFETAVLGSTQSHDFLHSLNTFHPHMQPPGRSVVNAPVPLGGHLSHWAIKQAGPENQCLEEPHRTGSWGEVIDRITPGKTIDQRRAQLNKTVQNPKVRKPTSLQRIEFISCGYVRLPRHFTLAQEHIAETMRKPPRCLRHRYRLLSKIMMRTDHDALLGTIAPAMPKQESDVLQVAFHMRMGWKKSDLTQYESREDGQPVGGSGRFSGVVSRSVEPNNG